MYIVPSRQEREILFEATRTCIWLKLDVCSMRVWFATQQRDTNGLINHQVKYFAKANSAFTIFLHRGHGRLIIYQFQFVSLLSNRDSKVTKRIPSSWSSSSSVMSPSSTTRVNSAERAFPFTANYSDSTSHGNDVSLDNSSFEDIFHRIKPPKRWLSEC